MRPLPAQRVGDRAASDLLMRNAFSLVESGPSVERKHASERVLDARRQMRATAPRAESHSQNASTGILHRFAGWFKGKTISKGEDGAGAKSSASGLPSSFSQPDNGSDSDAESESVVPPPPLALAAADSTREKPRLHHNASFNDLNDAIASND